VGELGAAVVGAAAEEDDRRTVGVGGGAHAERLPRNCF
jgi:hypothetical protein